MALLHDEYTLTLTETGVLELRDPENDNEGRIVLREPTNKEWNDYSANTFSVGKKRKVTDTSGQARCVLFDKIVSAIDHVEDSRGAVTLQDLDRIPARYKQRAVFLCFEDDAQEVDEKN